MKKLGILIVAALILASPVAFANYGGGHGQCNSGDSGFEGKFFHKAHAIVEHGEEIGLTEEQLDGIRNMKYDVKKVLIKQDADIEILGIDIKRQLQERSFDTEAVNKLVDQKYDLEKAKAKFLVESIAKLKQSLSEEQWEKLKDLKGEMRDSSKMKEMKKH